MNELKLEAGYWQASRIAAARTLRSLLSDGGRISEEVTNLLAVVMVPGCDFSGYTLAEIQIELLDNADRILG